MKLLIIAFMVLFTSCTDIKVEVRSDTSWVGLFDGAAIEDFGSTTIDLNDDTPVCVEIQKTTEEGFLRAHIYDDAWWFFGGNDDMEETTVNFGIVSVCAE